MTTMGANRTLIEPSQDDCASWPEVLLGALPFVLFGLVSLWMELVKLFQIRMLPGHLLYMVLGCYALFTLILGIGWTRGFPRWSFPYLAFVLVFSQYWTTMPAPPFAVLGNTLHPNEFWGWRAWLLPIIVAMAAALATRSFHPFRQFLERIWHDWTLVTFAFYGTLPLLMWWSIDETHGIYPVIHLLATTMLLSGGAVAYMRSTDLQHRGVFLLVSVVLSSILALTGSALYWDGHVEPWMSEAPPRWYDAITRGLVPLSVGLALFFSPALIGISRRVTEGMRAA